MCTCVHIFLCFRFLSLFLVLLISRRSKKHVKTNFKMLDIVKTMLYRPTIFLVGREIFIGDLCVVIYVVNLSEHSLSTF